VTRGKEDRVRGQGQPTWFINKMSDSDDDMDYVPAFGGDTPTAPANPDDTLQFRGLRNRTVHYSMAPRPLNTTLKAYSVALMPGQERHAVDHGGKSKLFKSIQ